MQKLPGCEELTFSIAHPSSNIFFLLYNPTALDPCLFYLPNLTSLIESLLNVFLIFTEMLAIAIMENMDKFEKEK